MGILPIPVGKPENLWYLARCVRARSPAGRDPYAPAVRAMPRPHAHWGSALSHVTVARAFARHNRASTARLSARAPRHTAAAGVAALATLAALAPHARAALALFGDRAAWQAAVNGPIALETFEDYAPTDVTLPGTAPTGLSARFVAGNVSVFVGAGDPDGHGFANTTPAGRNYLGFGRRVGDAWETGDFVVGLSGGPMTAFAFDLSGWQPAFSVGLLSLQLVRNGQPFDGTIVPGDAFDPSARFIGVTSDQVFDEIWVGIAAFPQFGGIADFVALDDIAWAVPTPGTTAALALTALAAGRRRRNASR